MHKIAIKTAVPGPRSDAFFRQPYINRFIAGNPDNETHLDVVFEHAEGSFLWDVDGNIYVDCGHSLNLPFGHAPLSFVSEATVINSSNYMTPQRYALVQHLSELFPHMAGFQFRSSGTESVEAAVRFARACEPRGLSIALAGAYHGLTLAAQQLMGKADGDPVRVLAFPNEATTASLLEDVESLLRRGPLLFVFEMVQGGTLQALPKVFLDGLSQLKERYPYQLYLLCDDMLLSVRCGRWCSAPDSLPIDLHVGGKSWSSGYPFSFVAVSKRVRDKAGDILGTTTYGANPVACLAAAATIGRLRHENTLGAITRHGEFLHREAVSRWSQLEHVRRAASHGLLFGFQMESLAAAREIGIRLMRSGVMCSRIQDVLRFSPPLNISAETLIEVERIVTKVLKDK